MRLAVLTEMTTLGRLDVLHPSSELWDYPTLHVGDVVVIRPDLWHYVANRLDSMNRYVVMAGGGRIGWLYRDEVLALEDSAEDNETQEEDNDEVHQASPHRGGQEHSQDPLGGSHPAAYR